MRRGEILDVKEVDALAEDLRLVVLLDAETLARIAPSETLLQNCQFSFVAHGVPHFRRPELGRSGLRLQGFVFQSARSWP